MVAIVSTSPDASVVKHVICRNCGATLAYVPRDVKNRIDTDYTGGRDNVRFIICPNCGSSVTVG